MTHYYFISMEVRGNLEVSYSGGKSGIGGKLACPPRNIMGS
jgi:hypothetical protein